MKFPALIGTVRRIDRWWDDCRARWWLVGALLVSAGIAAAMGGRAWHASVARLGELDASIKAARRANDTAALMPPTGVSKMEDFVSALPGDMSTATLVQQLQQESASAGVTLVSVQVTARRDSAEQLGQTELAIQLRGQYAACKQVIKQVLERHTNLTLGNLRMRKAQTASEIEMQLNILAWTRPAQTATPAAPVGRH